MASRLLVRELVVILSLSLSLSLSVSRVFHALDVASIFENVGPGNYGSSGSEDKNKYIREQSGSNTNFDRDNETNAR